MKKCRPQGRRNFLKAAAAGTAAIALNPRVKNVFSASEITPGPGNKWPGKVVINFNEGAVSSGEVDVETNIKMIDQSIKLLAEKNDLGEAWKAVFPDTLSASSKIAVKIVAYNPFKSGLHWSCARAVTDGLLQIDFDGAKLPPENITIYEMNTSGVSDAFTVAGYISDNFPSGVTIESAKNPVDGGDGALNNRRYSSVLKEADFLINCFNTRGHMLGDNDGKFTLGFKSHFGSYDDPWGMHDSNGGVSKNIRELICTGPVYQKQVLCICDSPFGCNESNGPGGISQSDNLAPDNFSTYAKKIVEDTSATNPSTVIMSTDPVTAEMQAIKIMRMNENGQYGPSDLPGYVQSAAGIDKSGFSPTYNIGIMNESEMTIYRIINDEIIDGPSTSARHSPSAGHPSTAPAVVAHPVRSGSSVFIEYNLPEKLIGKKATLSLLNARGEVVKTSTLPVTGLRNHSSWNRRDRHGKRVAKGLYIVRLTCGALQLASRFTL